MVSIYSIPIETTLGIARHYYLSEDGDFKNSVGWGPAGVEWKGTIELTPEELKRVQEYADLCSIKYPEIEKSIVDHLESNLQEIKKKKLLEEQAARDEFWKNRDAEKS